MTMPNNTGPMTKDNMVEALGAVRSLKQEFQRWLDIGPNNQPHYHEGIRPFSTGDLKQFVIALDASIAALSIPRLEAGRVTEAIATMHGSDSGALRAALVEARPVVMAMTGTEWAGIGNFRSWQEADNSLRAIKAKIDAALNTETDHAE